MGKIVPLESWPGDDFLCRLQAPEKREFHNPAKPSLSVVLLKVRVNFS
jgi:hypothetical protein